MHALVPVAIGAAGLARKRPGQGLLSGRSNQPPKIGMGQAVRGCRVDAGVSCQWNRSMSGENAGTREMRRKMP